MKVYGTDIIEIDPRDAETGIEMTDLQSLLSSSYFVSVNAPKLDQLSSHQQRHAGVDETKCGVDHHCPRTIVRPARSKRCRSNVCGARRRLEHEPLPSKSS
jgi:hypothetical protein